MKLKISPVIILIASATIVFLGLYAFNFMGSRRIKQNQQPRPMVSSTPVSSSSTTQTTAAMAPSSDTEADASIGISADIVPRPDTLQYTARHPSINIDSVSEAEEKTQEKPAAVHYASPVPFKFEPHPDLATSGTGYAIPANESKNELFSRFQ